MKLLLEAARQDDIPICVSVLTATEFIGSCAEIRLAEAVNDGQYRPDDPRHAARGHRSRRRRWRADSACLVTAC